MSTSVSGPENNKKISTYSLKNQFVPWNLKVINVLSLMGLEVDGTTNKTNLKNYSVT